MSLTSYRAAPPRDTICGRTRIETALLMLERPERGRSCRHAAEIVKIEKLDVRLADLAATYSPAS